MDTTIQDRIDLGYKYALNNNLERARKVLQNSRLFATPEEYKIVREREQEMFLVSPRLNIDFKNTILAGELDIRDKYSVPPMDKIRELLPKEWRNAKIVYYYNGDGKFYREWHLTLENNGKQASINIDALWRVYY